MSWKEGAIVSFRFLFLLLLQAALLIPQANATLIVAVSDNDMVDSSIAIVVGEVIGIKSYRDPNQGQIFSNITLSIDEILKGNLHLRELTIKQVGGKSGDLVSWVFGNPQFSLGEKVLLFLTSRADGTLQVAHLYWGKFSIVFDKQTGKEIASRGAAPRGVRLLRGPIAKSVHSGHDLRDFEELKSEIRSLVDASKAATTASSTVLSAPAPDVVEVTAGFELLGPFRWFEADDGTPVTMFMNSDGEPLAPTNGFDQIRLAYNAWNSTSSPFRYEDGGFTSAVGFVLDGINTLSFRDPLGQIVSPVNCSGTLAVSTIVAALKPTIIVNGQKFIKALDGDVVFADGWDGCGFYEDFDKVAEVAAHELGHVLGLDHSDDPDALMYPFAHFDGRGASLTQDEVDGLLFIYPVPFYDLAVSSLSAPKSVKVKSPVTKPVKVTFQNLGDHNETVEASDLGDGITTGLIRLSVIVEDDDGEGCQVDPATVALDAAKNAKIFSKGPKVLKPGKSLKVNFLVTYDCTAALKANKGDATPGDYSYVATVHHDVLNGQSDSNTTNDTLNGSLQTNVVGNL